jgi:hypothetical protein
VASRPRIALRVLGVPLIGDCTGPNHELSERLFCHMSGKGFPPSVQAPLGRLSPNSLGLKAPETTPLGTTATASSDATSNASSPPRYVPWTATKSLRGAIAARTCAIALPKYSKGILMSPQERPGRPKYANASVA